MMPQTSLRHFNRALDMNWLRAGKDKQPKHADEKEQQSEQTSRLIIIRF